MTDSRANLVIEDMIPTPNDDAFFAMMLDEGVPPPLVSQILLRLLDHPDADRSLPVTPMESALTPRQRISPLFAVFVAFVMLMANNLWLKSIFG